MYGYPSYGYGCPGYGGGYGGIGWIWIIIVIFILFIIVCPFFNNSFEHGNGCRCRACGCRD